MTYASVPTRYESTGTMVFTSPSSGGRFSDNTKPEDVVRVNPLLAFDGSLTTTAQILTQVLGDPMTRTELAGEKSTSTYTANTGPVGGPLLFVTAEADSPDQAQALVTKVLERASVELDARQRTLNAPEPTFITAQVLVRPTSAEAKIGGKVRFVGAAAVVLLLLTIAVTFGSDSVLNKAKRRKDTEPAEVDGDGDEPDDVDVPPGSHRPRPPADTPPRPVRSDPLDSSRTPARHAPQDAPDAPRHPVRPASQDGHDHTRPPARPQPEAPRQQPVRQQRNGVTTPKPEHLANQATVFISAPKADPTWPSSEDPRTR
ncbi:hypothetical protein [Umezawaea sp.]|uniref:hypothetical protein n=1 Tax=Umezawaea sp. TaxID=1955258 RepID=UPI002ED077C9